MTVDHTHVLPETDDVPVAAPVDGHPEDRCGRCGRQNVSWVVPSDRFNAACSRSEIVCPVCFVQAHEAATGMACTWEMVPATPFRWIDDEGRPTPFEPVAAQVDGDLVARLRRWRNVASAVDAHEAADEIERLRELTAGEDFLLDAQADVIAGLQAEIERLRAALREIRALHEPEWASEKAKAAGKEPWVCSLCGTADGYWPCDTIDTIREVLGDE